MHKPMLPATLLAAAFAALAACNANPPPASPSEAAPPQQAPAAPVPAAPAATNATAPPSTSDAPAFADRVWRVVAGGAVEAGSTYAFLGDGTLLMESPHGTPSTGSWSYADGRLTMTEEGIAYPVDIVLLQDNRFTIRSNNPGGAVVIEMTAAPEVALPQVR